MCPGVNLWIYPTWNLLTVWMCSIMFSITFGKILAIIPSNSFSAPLSSLSRFPLCILFMLYGVPCLFFFLVFSLYSVDWRIYWPFFKFVDSFPLPAPIYCSAPPVNRSLQLLHFTTPDFLSDSLKKFFSISLFIFSIWWDSCHTLIFKIVSFSFQIFCFSFRYAEYIYNSWFKAFATEPNTSLLRGSVDCPWVFYPSLWDMLVFFCVYHSFLVENGHYR